MWLRLRVLTTRAGVNAGGTVGLGANMLLRESFAALLRYCVGVLPLACWLRC
jgi:hypothetical protein